MESVIMLIPYFGKWPEWMPFYWISCRYNPTIQWVFYSDCDVPADLPPNVRLVSITFQEYSQLVSKALEIDFKPENPLKLCDIKPALGAIHQDAIQGYDFWGFGDIDVIYGDIRRFYDDDVFRHNLISAHWKGISGHFCLLRNMPQINFAFKKVREWKALLETDRNIRFDEGVFRKIFLKGRTQFRPVHLIRTMLSSYARNALFIERFSTPCGYYTDSPETQMPPEKFLWRRGKLYSAFRPHNEFLYLHFMNWKPNYPYFYINGKKGVTAWTTLASINHVPENRIADEWYIGHDGFTSGVTPVVDDKH